MKFVWDDKKNKINIRKHGIDFSDTTEMFNHPMVIKLDECRDYGEDRWIGIGLLKHIIAVIVYTEQKVGNQDVIRIISARKATTYECNRYEKEIRY